MECTVSWTGAFGHAFGHGFPGRDRQRHTLMMDGAPDAAKPENGGQNLAPRPMETLLAGAGGCTAYDVVLILKRGRHDVRGCSCKLTASAPRPTPRCSPPIHMHFTVTGQGRSRAAVERAIAMSHDKYCSATIMLGKTAAITTSFELVEAESGEPMRSPRGCLRLAGRALRPDWTRPTFTPRAGTTFSDAVRDGRHHLGGRRISPDRCRQVDAPACSASRAWRASSSFICATMAREALVAGPAGAPGGLQVRLDLALGLHHKAQADAVAAQRPASRPMPKAPAYHSGLSSEGAPSSSSRCASRPGGRFPRRWPRSCRRSAGSRVASACAVYSAWAQTSPTWLTRIKAPAAREAVAPDRQPRFLFVARVQRKGAEGRNSFAQKGPVWCNLWNFPKRRLALGPGGGGSN
jgi:putative redox protein